MHISGKNLRGWLATGRWRRLEQKEGMYDQTHDLPMHWTFPIRPLEIYRRRNWMIYPVPNKIKLSFSRLFFLYTGLGFCLGVCQIIYLITTIQSLLESSSRSTRVRRPDMRDENAQFEGPIRGQVHGERTRHLHKYLTLKWYNLKNGT